MMIHSLTKKIVEEIQEIYARRRKLLPDLFDPVDVRIREAAGDDELFRSLLYYLYGNLPLSDVMGTPFSVLLEYALHGKKLLEEQRYFSVTDEDRIRLFLQYVVYPRVNEEELASCRVQFFDELQDVLTDVEDAGEAVLAANYWCASHVTYHASDERCAGALTVYKSGVGRCGEESSFTVNVLRSIGIPARQVYAPRWAHCDDNHAWVEALVGDEWHFLGACEPEERLDKGWFLYASSRAVLIHSRWFGHMEPPKMTLKDKPDPIVSPVLARNGIVREMNETTRYAKTKPIAIRVTGADGGPLAASLRIELLNYSEWFPIVETRTDERGLWQGDIGFGTVRITAQKDEYRDVCILEPAQEAAGLRLSHREEATDSPDPDVFHVAVSPRDCVIHTGEVTRKQEAQKEEKLARAKELYRRRDRSWDRGEAAIRQFLLTSESEDTKAALSRRLVDNLAPKDRLDVAYPVLEEYLNHVRPFIRDDMSADELDGLMNCRVSFEVLADQIRPLAALAGKLGLSDLTVEPEKLYRALCERIRTLDGEEYDHLIAPSLDVLAHSVGTALSRDVLFVTLCRNFGIPARMDPALRIPCVWRQGAYRPAMPLRTGKLVIDCRQMEKSTYFDNWSVVYQGGNEQDASAVSPRLLDLSRQSAVWEKEGVLELTVPTGYYEIVTTNRLPDGDILFKQWDVRVKQDEACTVVPVTPRAGADRMLVDLTLPPVEIRQTGQTLEQLNEPCYQILAWIRAGQEPTEHLLNELIAQSGWIAKEKIGILLFTEDKEAAKGYPRLSRAMHEIGDIQLLEDDLPGHMERLGRRLYVNPELAPLLAVTAPDGQCIYAVSGYQVGTVDMIRKVVEIRRDQDA